jgi:hypothetical protein
VERHHEQGAYFSAKRAAIAGLDNSRSLELKIQPELPHLAGDPVAVADCRRRDFTVITMIDAPHHCF